MSVQPIDLQVLFSRLSQIGRDQAAHRDAQIQAQAVAGSEIAERSEEQDHRVSQPNDAEDGPETVNDESGSKQDDRGKQRREEDSETPEDGIFHDPDLG
ncbi:MAG: hypothetical protein ACOC2N_03830 [Spirochaetota bacterium]